MKEPIICIVGFLGSGKTTLLKQITDASVNADLDPYIVLNDYENAYLDLQQFKECVSDNQLKALHGSCICCSGLTQLRSYVNRIPERENGITLIEANGTSDACSLMESLGVGINERFLPPVQISVVDAKNWQQRGAHNELEFNQIQVSSLLVLTYLDQVSASRKAEVIASLKKANPQALIVDKKDFSLDLLQALLPNKREYLKMEHQKAHWSSASVDMPTLTDSKQIEEICNTVPNSILRLKGCCQIKGNSGYLYFERTPDGSVYSRPFNGEPSTGPKILTIGPGSSIELLQKGINQVMANYV